MLLETRQVLNEELKFDIERHKNDCHILNQLNGQLIKMLVYAYLFYSA